MHSHLGWSVYLNYPFMKKFIYLTAAAVTALGATSCSQDDAPSSVEEGMTVFSVKLPDDLGTRTYGDAPSNQQLNVAIYEAGNKETPLFTSINGTTSDGMTVEQFTENGLTATVKVPLVKNKQYDLVFWSQDKDTHPYTYTANGQTLTVNYGSGENTAIDNFAENRDAFFASKSITSGDAANSQTIQLKRMFAQINVGTNDLTAYTNAGGTNEFGITVSGVANTIDLMTGIVSNPTETVTATTANAASSSQAFPEINGYTGNTLKYLGMAYVLVGDGSANNKTTVDVSLYANSKTDFATYTSVPVQMNYRTNIYGALLTNPEVFNVEIDPIFAGSYNNPWSGEVIEPAIIENAVTITRPEELAGLSKMVADGKDLSGVTITLTDDMDMNNLPFTPIGSYLTPNYNKKFKGTFDGQGHTIKNLKVNAICAGLFGYIHEDTEIKNVTIDNATIKGSGFTGGAVALIHQGSKKPSLTGVTVKNSTITGNKKVGGLAGFFQSNVYIDGCVVENCTITANTQGGGLFGMGTFGGFNATTIQNNTVKDSQVIWNLGSAAETVADCCNTLVGGGTANTPGQTALLNYNANNVATNVTLTKK